MTADPRPTLVPDQDINLDLGFGSVVARESRKRLLNRDGTFNVQRTGLAFWQSHSAYHYFLTLSWPRFLAYVGVAYVLLPDRFNLYLSTPRPVADQMYVFAERLREAVHELDDLLADDLGRGNG